jgi:uncharacterized protein YutE (UPF0331/DUF86 family)
VTDADLIAKKLALIETCVQQLRQLARPAAIATDVREEPPCGGWSASGTSVVHGYEVVDLRIVIDIFEHGLDDLLAFVAAMRARLE